MYSVKDDQVILVGFPHSEISGSKLVCKLPEAYRMLQRPSSPLIAKASTVCAYSLDHITPISLDQNPILSNKTSFFALTVLYLSADIFAFLLENNFIAFLL